MRDVQAKTTGLPHARPARRTGRYELGRLVAVVFASLCLTACGSASSTKPVSARAVKSVTAGTAAVLGASSPTASASPLNRVDAQRPAAPVPTPAPSGRTLIRGSQLTFMSVRYGYSLTVNANDWLVIETPGSWDGTFDLHQDNPDPGTDWIRDPGVATIEIGVLSVAPGTTLAAWETSEAPAVRMLACKETGPAESAMDAGATVLLLPETCPKAFVGGNRGDEYLLNAFLIHGTSGVVAQWKSEQGHEAADRASLLAILATWAWASR